jgi:serine/threonine-protein kinase
MMGFILAIVLSVIAFGVVLAWRNARARRGDRPAAARAALAVFAFDFISLLLQANHQPSVTHEVAILARCTADALLWGTVVYVLYLALEPFVRRRWPELLIGSTRLLSGNVRDPMVGRDVLVGILGGVLHVALIGASIMFAAATGGTQQPPHDGDLSRLTAARQVVSHLVAGLSSGIFMGFVVIVVLTVFIMLFRRRALAFVGLNAVVMTGFFFAFGGFPIGPLLISLVLTTMAVRYGMLAMAVAHASFAALFHFPQFVGGSWFTLGALVPVAVVAVAALWAFRTSLGNQSPFNTSLLDA